MANGPYRYDIADLWELLRMPRPIRPTVDVDALDADLATEGVLPIDPDSAPAGRLRPGAAAVLGSVFVGGGLGGAARYALSGINETHVVPWATFAVNVIGAWLLGALLVVILEVGRPSRLIRPFLATGFCGGFTTFSTFAVEVDTLASHGHGIAAAGYALGSVGAGLIAAALGIATGQAMLILRRRERGGSGTRHDQEAR